MVVLALLVARQIDRLAGSHGAGCPMPKLEMLEAELRFLETERV